MSSEDKGAGHVANIADARGKRKPKTEGTPGDDGKQPKVPAHEIYATIAGIIDRTELDQKLYAPFPATFAAIEPEPGAREVIEVDELHQARLVSPARVRQVVAAYCQVHMGPCFQLLPSALKDCVEFWLTRTRQVVAPSMVACAHDGGVTWRRLPFDLLPGATLAWDDILARVAPSARLPLMAWLGSVLVPESYNQQYVWLYGEGGNGKGAIARFLRRLLGQAVHPLTYVPKRPNQFFTYQFIGKRLVVANDCDQNEFVADGLFKALSGGDPINCERKGGASFSVDLNAKWLFASNKVPRLTSQRADMRRAIFVPFEGAPAEWVAGFEERLWEEGGAFMARCLDAYKALAPGHGPIPVEADELLAHVSIEEERYEEIFDEWLEDVGNPLAEISAKHMNALKWRLFKTKRDVDGFAAYLLRRGVKKCRKPDRRYYMGASLKKDSRTLLEALGERGDE